MSMIKEIAVTPLTECSWDTGYTYEFLSMLVDDAVKDGQSLPEAVQYVTAMAYEQDLDEMNLDDAIEMAIDECNLIGGDDIDIVEVLYGYKVIRDLPDEEFDKVYDTVARSLGYLTNE